MVNENMHIEEKIMSSYDAIAAASGRMLEAARAADWDGLVAAERECAGLIEEVRRLNSSEKLSAACQARRMTAIRKVLAHDAEIRSITQPWLEKLESFLTGQDNTHRLRTTYR